MSLSSLESCIYPLKKSCRFEVEDVGSLEDGYRFSRPVKVGKTEWCLFVTMECSNRTNNKTYLGVFFMNLNCFDENDDVDVVCTACLLPKTGSELVRNVCGEPDKKYKFVYPCWGWINFIEKAELMNNGYVRNGMITIEWEIEIICEKNFNKSLRLFESRPNCDDVNKICSNSKANYEPKQKTIEVEFELSQISNATSYSHVFYVEEIPCRIGVKKEGSGSLRVYFYCNSDDRSEWWRVEAAVKIRIKRREKSAEYLAGRFLPKRFSSGNCCFEDCFNWYRISKFENGYVKHGRICVEVIVHIRNKYGFNDKTGRGIEKPMKKMTDAVVSVGEQQFPVSRMILSHQSSWFRELFFNDPDKSEFKISNIREDLFISFLHLVYNKSFWIRGTVAGNESDISSLLELLNTFRADECIKRLDLHIADRKTSDDISMLKLIDKYRLSNTKAKYVKKYQNMNDLRKLLRDPDVVKLSDELRAALTLAEIPKREEEEKIPFYVYSTKMTQHRKTPGPAEKLKMFFAENREARELLEDPEVQNGGNSILSFLSQEEPEFVQILFKEFSDPSDMVTINFKDNKIFHSSKQILANASEYFMKRYFGLDAKDDDNTLIFDKISSDDFNILMNHIYHPTIPVTASNLEILLPLAYRFGVTDVLTKCEYYIIETEKITVDEKENLAEVFNLEYLLSACKNYKEEE